MEKSSTSVNLCTICQADDVIKHASVWCFECEEFLCSECSRVHSRSRLSKEHKVTTIEDYRNLPQFVLDIKNICSDHDEKYEYYCSFHGNACCVKCLHEVHRECRELRPIREVLENFKSSAAVPHLEDNLQKIGKNLNEVVKYLKSRRNKNQEQSSKILKEIQRIRADIINHLDRIEQKIVDELLSEQKCIDDKLDKITKEVEEKSRQIITIREDFSKMTRHATALQTYIGLKKIESTAKKEDNYLANLVDNPEMKETTLEMEVSQQLKTLVRDIASFGKIVVRTSESMVMGNMKLSGQQSAQLLVQTPKTIHELQLSKIFRIDVEGEQIYGCNIFPDGRMAFVDYNKSHLLLYNREGYIIKQIGISGNPGACAYVKNNHIAVSIPKMKMVQLIDIRESSTAREVLVEWECWDITAEDRKLYVRANGCNAVHVFDLDSSAVDKITQKVQIYGFYLLNISVFNDKIYCTNWKVNTLYCYDMAGTQLWTFQQQDLLEPRGIALDNVGFVYVACRKSNKLMVISSDGKESKVLLDEKDGLVSPEALHINRDLSLLLIGSKQKAFLYKI